VVLVLAERSKFHLGHPGLEHGVELLAHVLRSVVHGEAQLAEGLNHEGLSAKANHDVF